MSDEADWDDWIEVVTTEGVNLTTWEQEFVESLRQQRQNGRKLSERQVEILERIYSERTP